MNFFRISKNSHPNIHYSSYFFRFSSSPKTPVTLTSLDTSSKSKALHINIPSTSFNPRFHAKTSETHYHPLISEDLYRWQQEIYSNCKEFFLHEAPVSLHEELHLGHFFNKTIKDIIMRNKMMQGNKINAVMGFNCHGPVIENAAIRKYTEETDRAKLSVENIRDICKRYVNERFEDYIKTIKRWGIMTDISKAYLTTSILYPFFIFF